MFLHSNPVEIQSLQKWKIWYGMNKYNTEEMRITKAVMNYTKIRMTLKNTRRKWLLYVYCTLIDFMHYFVCRAWKNVSFSIWRSYMLFKEYTCNRYLILLTPSLSRFGILLKWYKVYTIFDVYDSTTNNCEPGYIDKLIK